MNTGELIKHLAKNLEISQKEARRLLDQELNGISEQLSLGNNVIVRGFGSFNLKDTRTDNKKSIAFKASQKLKEFIKSWRPS